MKERSQTQGLYDPFMRHPGKCRTGTEKQISGHQELGGREGADYREAQKNLGDEGAVLRDHRGGGS